uniref:DUF6680 domain-containing protein n=1 Tax=uncultured organism TaxID=155900 RepID=M1Q1J4_9ZZZZ|nr:hypothetical protein FLSS-17_0025 [uncultured organism]
MELTQWLTIGALCLNPLAILAVFYLEKWWRRGEWERRRKEEVVYNLMGARGGTRTTLNAKELEKALNSIPIIFNDNQKIIEAYNSFKEENSRQNPDSDVLTNKLTKLIQTVCRETGYDVEESTVKDILNLHMDKFS